MPPHHKQSLERSDLPPTLGGRVNQLRQRKNLTVRDLSRMTKLSLERIEDIEGSVETWLSTADRQLIAKALAIDPYVLQEVETRQTGQTDEVRYSVQQTLAERILEGERELSCPNCSGVLRCSVQEALDMDGNPIQFAKAFCLKCPFILK